MNIMRFLLSTAVFHKTKHPAVRIAECCFPLFLQECLVGFHIFLFKFVKFPHEAKNFRVRIFILPQILQGIGHSHAAALNQHLSHVGGGFVIHRLKVDHQIRFQPVKHADGFFVMSPLFQKPSGLFVELPVLFQLLLHTFFKLLIIGKFDQLA